MTAAETGDNFEGDVIAAFGRQVIVRAAPASGRGEVRARPAGRKLVVVCGDRVRCESDRAHNEVLIVEVLPRRSLLARSSVRGDSEPVVANITQLVVVIAPVPQPDFFIVDRYLCAATSAGVMGAIAVNKSDLEDGSVVADEIAALTATGYRHISCSAKVGSGLDELRTLLKGDVSVLVGQSGVGKSSIVGALIPESDIATGGLMREGEGRHTTTASRSYELASGGTLIDSPGVRDFAPAVDRLDEKTLGFPEIQQRAGKCKFQDCKHLQEPGCAIIAATGTGAMSARRYESYRRLRRTYNDLVESQGYGNRRR
jgi:ribosome biogenesis GTPase